MYWNTLHHLFQATDQILDPAAVVCDFKVGLLNAVVTQFPDDEIIRCYFHFIQALGRKMVKLSIPAARSLAPWSWAV